MMSALELARRIADAADEVSASDGASRKAAIRRLNSLTDNQHGVVQIARALLSTSASERERLLCGECGTITRDKQCHCTEAGEEPHWFNYTDWLASEVNRLDASERRMREALEKIAEPMGSLQSWERGAHRRDIALKALAALSEQARGQGRSAPTDRL